MFKFEWVGKEPNVNDKGSIIKDILDNFQGATADLLIFHTTVLPNEDMAVSFGKEGVTDTIFVDYIPADEVEWITSSIGEIENA